MSTFINNDITNGGRLLLAKGHMGERIEFTKIVMGDGYLPQGASIRDLTAVVNPVVNVPITKLKMNADGTVIIGGQFSNADLLTEFFYRELALFGKGEDGIELLYCYGNAGDFAERITPVGGSSVIEKTIDIVTAIGTTTNVTATIIRTTTADEIGYDDSVTMLGASSIQEAIELLAEGAGNETKADEIGYDDSVTMLGASSIQEAIAILAGSIGNRTPITIISETEPTEPCEIWLKPIGSAATPGGLAENGGQNIQPLIITGAHMGDEPPEDKGLVWYKPLEEVDGQSPLS